MRGRRRSGLFGWIGRIKWPKFKWPKFKIPFGKKKPRSVYKYVIKRDGGWGLKKFPGMPKSPSKRGWPVRVKQKSKTKRKPRK